jgi:hypothetical protein
MENTGRPTVYTAEIAKYICQELAEGRSLVSICQEDGMPHRSTVYDWLDTEVEDFPDRYARARARQAETMLDEIIEISDDTSRDTVTLKKGEIEIEVPNTEWILRSKLRVDSRKWAMSKLAPKKYGDKLALTDGDGKPLPTPEVRIYTGAPPLANSEKEVLQ